MHCVSNVIEIIASQKILLGNLLDFCPVCRSKPCPMKAILFETLLNSKEATSACQPSNSPKRQTNLENIPKWAVMKAAVFPSDMVCYFVRRKNGLLHYRPRSLAIRADCRKMVNNVDCKRTLSSQLSIFFS